MHSHQQRLQALDQQIATLMQQRQELLHHISSQSVAFDGIIEIIGGGGKLGQRFAQWFKDCGCKTRIFEVDHWPQAQRLTQADVVIICVPIHKTLDVISQLPNLPAHCILADMTSIKAITVQAMCQVHTGPVVGLHPMFGPQTTSPAGQTIAVCDGQQPQAYQRFLTFLAQLGFQLYPISAQEHDEITAFIQGLRHFNALVDGHFLCQQQVDLKKFYALSSPIYFLELTLTGRLFAQDPQLYIDLILSSEHYAHIIENAAQHYSRFAQYVRQQDHQALLRLFEETAAFFKEFSEQNLSDSETILNTTPRSKQQHWTHNKRA